MVTPEVGQGQGWELQNKQSQSELGLSADLHYGVPPVDVVPEVTAVHRVTVLLSLSPVSALSNLTKY